MDWLAQNGLVLFLTLLFLFLTLRGPILGRLYGVEHLTVHELSARLAAKGSFMLLDVRTTMEFAGGHIAGARNVPLSSLSSEIAALKRQSVVPELILVCRSGARSLNGAVTMKRAGFSKVYNVSGGMLQWSAQGYPVRQ